MNKYFLLVSLFFLLFLISFTTVFQILPVVSVNNDDDGFFGIFPEDYYDLSYYGEEIPSISDPLDEVNSTTTAMETELNNTLLPHTVTNDIVGKITTNPLSENYSDDINFIAAGDWSCNKQTEKTINKITKLEPELVLGLGDYTYKSISPQCWFDISEPIDNIIKIAIGNHDWTTKVPIANYLIIII